MTAITFIIIIAILVLIVGSLITITSVKEKKRNIKRQLDEIITMIDKELCEGGGDK